MNEKLKKFLEFASENKEAKEKFDALKDESDKDKVVSETIAIAKEHGFELSPDDFAAHAHELDSAELASVAGGDYCQCIVAGGGHEEVVEETSDSPGYTNPPCGCALYGQGNYADGGIRCTCIMGGSGMAH